MLDEGKHGSDRQNQFSSFIGRKTCQSAALESCRPCRLTSSLFITLQTSLFWQSVLRQYKLLRWPVDHFGEGLGEAQTAGGGERGRDVCHRFGCVAG